MNACLCHLCGEAMEPDVVALQGDTCEPCFFRHVIPVDVVAQHEQRFPQVADFVEALEVQFAIEGEG